MAPLALIDRPLSPPLRLVGPAARCPQEEDQYLPLRPAAAANIHFEGIDAMIKSNLFIYMSSLAAGF